MTAPSANETWTLDTRLVGRRVLVYDHVESTNSVAFEFADQPDHHGMTVLARAQTVGRGQYGRTWHAPAGSSVLMSILLFPPKPLQRPALLTAWAAVSVCEAISNLTKYQATIKWPNDVLVLGKKVCGILIEQRTAGTADSPLATVVGIGLNVTQSAEMFVDADLPFAGSLASMTGLALSYENVAKELIRRLDWQYQRMIEGDFPALEASWKSRLGLLGKFVVVEGHQHHYRGRLLDVTLAGLDLEVGPDDVVRLMPEAIRHIERAE